MNRRRLEVQFCVLNDITRRYGPHPTSDLLGVDYFRPVPADTEFPYTMPRLDLFVRFLVARLGPTEIAVRVRRLKDDGTNGERVAGTPGPSSRSTRPTRLSGASVPIG